MNQVIRFALETVMRRGELAGMTREMVDLRKRTVTLPETNVAISILKDRPGTRRFDGKVRDIGPDAISRDFAKACRNAGRTGRHFHDLRHEATSQFFEKGLKFDAGGVHYRP
ncbi:hypothetical protein [Leptospirillum ferriphilum]|uniref:Tyr recombinase domain-containing protein n=1 Tax=Leptospirillum ferriphilum TaxID=178606 RepID=A0A1V3SX35_9BACT|nr:hypothetical protein [Leptospirillum ferriphilum]OOH73975.1 hypothetical protein BOX24_02995 [Leptospirillum ferriphilum]